MKNNKRILALLLAILMLATLFVGCGKQEAAVEEPAEEVHDHSHEAETESAETAEPAELVKGHHTNAHGMESFSIHYFTKDGGTAYEYMNEAGELVSVSQEEVDAYMDEIIATCADYSLTNRGLAVCYQEQYNQTYQAYGIYMMMLIDSNKGLDEQVGGDGTNTWQYSFMDAGVKMFHRMAAVVTEAEKQGFDTTEAMALVEEGKKALEDSAAQVGYTDLDKFVQDYMGPGATLESYLEIVELQAIFQSYAEHLQAQVEVTDEQIDAYYTEKEAELAESYPKVDKNVVNVRHILIAPEETTAEDGTTSISDEAWAEAEAKANNIYQMWQDGEADEEYFATLAKQHTEDPGSAENGGLYEDVYPGQMVTEFNDWCFADGRKVGDTAIVKTSYGYHIMFFSGEGDYIYWRKSVKDMITAEDVTKQLEAIEAVYPLEYDLTNAIIMDKTAPTVPSAEGEDTSDALGIGEYDYETGILEDPTAEEHVHTEDDGHNH